MSASSRSSSPNSNVPPTSSPSYTMRRTSSDDETRRGDSRPTLPPIRDLFGRELSQPPHPSASGTPVHYSPSSRASQPALTDESAYRGEQGRGGYNPSHGHAQAGGHTHLRALTTPYHSPQRAQPAGYTGSTPPARPFVPFHTELPETTRPASSSSTRSAYDTTRGTTQYSYPPPPPPIHQSYTVGSTSRAPPMGYHYARSIAPSYSGFGSITPSGMVAPEQPSAKYECQYCGKGFTRPSSLKIHVHSHTGERPFRCTHEGCNRTFSVQSNMRRHARTHLQSGNDTRESEGEEESEEGSPQPPQGVQQAQIPHSR
ncbi:hypothetical protein BGY98DRAFT_534573 [Russula aff. rugulosa BPL654]|nr:hypothetical protein BGY98DRAFT_534573 [Russula aff. rugulosa BPL654]